MCREGLTRGISWGKRSRVTMQGLIKHDKADVGCSLLEVAPVQVFYHSGDTCFTVVVVTNTPEVGVWGMELHLPCFFPLGQFV